MTTITTPTVPLRDEKEPGVAPAAEPMTSTATNRVLQRPDFVPAPPASDEEDHFVLEPQFDAEELLAAQDREVEYDLGRLHETEGDEVTTGNENAEFLFKADDDWYDKILDSQRIAGESMVKAHIQTAEGAGYQSPEEAQAAADRAAKYTFWRLTTILLTTATALTFVASLLLAGSAA